MQSRLVNLDGSVNLADEEEGAQETDGPRDEEEAAGDDEHVAHVDRESDGAGHLQLGEGIVDRVDKEVEGTAPRREEGAPPPVVVFAAELEVDHDDGDLSARQQEDDEHEEEEPKEVVELVQPDRRQHVKHLDKDRPKRQHPSHNDVEGAVHEPRGLGDLAGDLVGPDRVLDGLLAETKVCTRQHEGRGDAQPHAEEGKEGAKRDRPRRLLPPDQEVEDEEDAEDAARVQHRSPQAVALPPVALEHAEKPCRGVPPKHPHEDKEEERRLHERAPVGGGEEPEAREEHQDEGGHGELDARAGQHRQPTGHHGRPENVSVHQLPPGLLLSLLEEVLLLVPLEVAAEGADHDHGNEAGEEEDDHERVEDREPVHLRVVGRLQVGVPAGGPADGGGLVVDVIGPDDLGAVLLVRVQQHRFGREVDLLVLGAREEVAVPPLPRHLVEALLPVDLVHVLVLDAEGLDLEPDDADPVPVGVFVVQDGETEVVEQKDLGLLSELLPRHLLTLLVNGRVDETEGVPRLVRLGGLTVVSLVKHRHGGGEVVEKKVRAILLLNHQNKGLDVRPVVASAAEHLARLVVAQLERVGGVVDAGSPQNLAQIQSLLRLHVHPLIAEGEDVVFIGQLRPH
mmetsp:Transcript_35291/g.82630  ORF Transcript_35291/g.82630 Transcript_35291/m.82630 type:complete len:624 (-) Transcript_35291:173-2044(-)